MKLGGHGGHTDLVGHVGQGLDVAEYLVDVCAVDRVILTHGTTPESRVKFLLQYSVHDAMQSTTRQETSQTRAERPRHQSNLELSHGLGNASSKFARRTRFDKLSPEPLIDPRQPG